MFELLVRVWKVGVGPAAVGTTVGTETVGFKVGLSFEVGVGLRVGVGFEVGVGFKVGVTLPGLTVADGLEGNEVGLGFTTVGAIVMDGVLGVVELERFSRIRKKAPTRERTVKKIARIM